MVVCHCEAVSDREVRAAVRAGARSVDCLRRELGAATDCRGCEPRLQRLLADVGTAVGLPQSPAAV